MRKLECKLNLFYIWKRLTALLNHSLPENDNFFYFLTKLVVHYNYKFHTSYNFTWMRITDRRCHLFSRDINCKTIYKVSIAVEFRICSLIEQHPQKHIMFLLQVLAISYDQFTASRPQKTQRKSQDWRKTIFLMKNVIDNRLLVAHVTPLLKLIVVN